MQFTRNDGQVVAKIVAENDETVCFHAAWQEHGKTVYNPFTACSRERFYAEFSQ